MSFSQEVKEELIGVRLRHEEDGAELVAGAAAAAASLKYSRTLKKWGLHLVSENEKSIGFLAKLAWKAYGLSNEISLTVHERLNARNTELFLYGEGLERLCLDAGVMSIDENGEKSYDYRFPDGLDSDHLLRAFVRGVFLVCGTVADPSKSCHAELVLKNEQLARGLIGALSEKGVAPKLAKRRSLFIVYMKNGDTVEDFLTFMGAGESMLRLSEQRMIRGAANNSNREVNCYSANIDKAARASARQVEDIKLILSSLGFDALSEDLYELARIRMENPDLTLSQISELSGLGRSAVNYRLNKIKRLADEIRAAGEETEN